ncbi:MAG: tRNA threonylcarbamoyladenosine dehydratase [Candidatus Kapabacteria bacterium]|jgi:tRNA A37 threonylcarbamoyladenosine dehydratase|nr:tRNA threonylcarbamoyladenosine dehydratase [Candidatus Kapabacteria bacterium]
MRDPKADFASRLQAMTDGSWTSRTRLLLGDDRCDRLRDAHVLVMGQGGVGSFCSEFLARAGVGRLTLVDGDVVDPSNRNRQLCALTSTEGSYKVDVMRDRLRDINPDVRLITMREFLTPDRMERVLATKYDYVVDAIDSVTPKLYLIMEALRRGYPIVSSMGAGGKVDPSLIRISDLSETQRCPLARYVRKRLKRHGVYTGVTAVFSLEQTDEDSIMFTDGTNFKKSAFGTVSWLPAAFGGACASVVVRGLS